MRLNFKKCYEKYLVSGEKTTTCRLGKKNHRFRLGETVNLVVGDRYHPRTVATGVVRATYYLPWKQVTDKLLIGESPDCQTKEGLWCTMFHINKVLLDDNDWVTFIMWEKF